MILLSKISKPLQHHPFHSVYPSPRPFVSSLSTFSCTVGGVLYMRAFKQGAFVLSFSFLMFLSTMFDKETSFENQLLKCTIQVLWNKV